MESSIDAPTQELRDLKTSSNKGITWLIFAICWFSIFTEGYDLGIYGAVLPALLEDKQWSMTAIQAGAIGSYVLVGMILGAVIIGTLTDLIGRKWSLIICISLFCITMILCAMAPNPELFGFYRFIGGIGLGGVVPTATAITIEYSPAKRKSFIYALMYSGYSIGGVAGAFLAIFLLQEHGWRFLFYIGFLPILVVPIIIKFLPESIIFLRSKNRHTAAEEIIARYGLSTEEFGHNKYSEYSKIKEKRKLQSVTNLFKRENIRSTLLFWITFFMGFLMIYGLNTWLPKIMRESGYPMGASLAFLVALNAFAAIGPVLAGVIADRWGAKRVISISFFLASISIILLSIKFSIVLLFILVGIAGFGSYGGVILMNSYIQTFYPADNHATALGWAHGFGRIGAVCGPLLGGMLISWNVDLSWYFYIFSISGLLGTVCILFLREKAKGKVIKHG
ncbi:MFS transporter [Neobacillus pocheonensis]|uniref:MFS transporter n=1 Tax=Neobacillus pocheonensis TaxID=363869 RepID=UPI003D29763B